MRVPILQKIYNVILYIQKKKITLGVYVHIWINDNIQAGNAIFPVNQSQAFVSPTYRILLTMAFVLAAAMKKSKAVWYSSEATVFFIGGNNELIESID